MLKQITTHHMLCLRQKYIRTENGLRRLLEFCIALLPVSVARRRLHPQSQCPVQLLNHTLLDILSLSCRVRIKTSALPSSEVMMKPSKEMVCKGTFCIVKLHFPRTVSMFMKPGAEPITCIHNLPSPRLPCASHHLA